MQEFIEIPANKLSLSMRRPLFGIANNDANYIVQPIVSGKQVVCPIYQIWKDMLKRSYSQKFQEKNPTYAGCSVDNEWLTFSNFRRWVKKQEWENKQLDKDILIIGNKEYSPGRCVFVSRLVNNLLTDSAASRGNLPQGIYLDNKEGRYKAQCSAKGKVKNLGYFNTVPEAELAYLEFKALHVETIASGEPDNVKNGLLRHAAIMRIRIKDIKTQFNSQWH